jgi:hypothetical protein
MKMLSALFLFLLSLPAFAEKSPTHFVCGGMNGTAKSLSLQLGGGRYADAVMVDLEEGEAKRLLGASEQRLEIKDSSLNGFLRYGSCEQVAGSDVLVRCALAKPEAWSFLHLNFTTSKKLNENIWESSRVTRSTSSGDLEIIVRRVGEDAHLELSGSFMGLDGLSRLRVNRVAGSLKEAWNKCRFE